LRGAGDHASKRAVEAKSPRSNRQNGTGDAFKPLDQGFDRDHGTDISILER